MKTIFSLTDLTIVRVQIRVKADSRGEWEMSTAGVDDVFKAPLLYLQQLVVINQLVSISDN